MSGLFFSTTHLKNPPDYFFQTVHFELNTINELVIIYVMVDIDNIRVPKTWNEITLKQQMMVQRLTNDDDKYYAVIAGYCDLTIEQVKQLPIIKVKELLKQLSWTKEDPLPSAPVVEFVYKGDKYSVVDTLLKQQFQDFISIETAMQQYKGKEYEALPYIIAVLCKKTDETLDQFDITIRAKHFEDLPISIANGVYVFFLSDRTKVFARFPQGSKRTGLGNKTINQLYTDYSTDTGWWGKVYQLCEDDITRLHQVLTQRLEQALLWIQLRDRKNELDVAVQKAMEEEAKKRTKK